MRHKGSSNEYTDERDRDLLNVYRRIISEASHINLYEAVDKAVNSPAKRFYVSAYRARNVIMRMIKNKPLNNVYPCKKEMFAEIYRRVMVKRAFFPNKPLLIAIEEVLAEPAPKFYLEKESGVSILHKIQKKLRCQQKQHRYSMQ